MWASWGQWLGLPEMALGPVDAGEPAGLGLAGPAGCHQWSRYHLGDLDDKPSADVKGKMGTPCTMTFVARPGLWSMLSFSPALGQAGDHLPAGLPVTGDVCILTDSCPPRVTAGARMAVPARPWWPRVTSGFSFCLLEASLRMKGRLCSLRAGQLLRV